MLASQQSSRYGASTSRDYQQPSTSGAYFAAPRAPQQPSTSGQYFYRSPLTQVVFQCSECQKKFETREELYVHCEECLVEMFENEAMNALSDMNSPPQRALPAAAYRPAPHVTAGIVAKSSTPLVSPLNHHPKAKPAAEINGITVTATPVSAVRTYSNQQQSTVVQQPVYYEESAIYDEEYPHEEGGYVDEYAQSGTDSEIITESTKFVTSTGSRYFLAVESGIGTNGEGIDLSELDEDVLLESCPSEEQEEELDEQEMPQLEQISVVESQEEELYEYMDEAQFMQAEENEEDDEEEQNDYIQVVDTDQPSTSQQATSRYEPMHAESSHQQQQQQQQQQSSSSSTYRGPQPQTNVYRMTQQYPRYRINDVPPPPPQRTTTCDEGKPKMECPTCGLILYRHNFSTHYRIHTGEMPFSCQYCSKRFRTTSSLKVHIRAHTGEKPYQCPQCTYACITKRNLDRHIQNNHEKNGGEAPEGGPRYRKSRYRDEQYGSSTGVVWKPQAAQFPNQNPFSENFGRPIPVAVPVNPPPQQQNYVIASQDLHPPPKVIMPRNSTVQW